MAFALPFALLIGLSLGLLGSGGSILTVPILVYALDFGPKQAIVTGLAVVGTTSLVGAALHGRAGTLRLRAALPFGAVTSVGTFAGARVARFVPGEIQLLLFAGVMLVSAFFMLRKGRQPAPAASPAGARGGARGWWLMVPVALGVGALTGLTGIGGGFLIVPALVLLLRLPMAQAVGTSLLVIAVNSWVGFAGYAGQVDVAFGTLAGFTAVSVAGLVVGNALGKRYLSRGLEKVYSGVLAVMAVFLLVQNRSHLAFIPSEVYLPVAGGILIGVAASLLLLLNGRTAGISGILGGLLPPRRGEWVWRTAFVVGLVAGGGALLAAHPGLAGGSSVTGWQVPVAAGLLVGFGTRLGNGCTSGHGICGVSRGTRRSLVATATFMATGALTVFVVRHLMGGSLG